MSGRQFSTVMPPMATQGTTVAADQLARISRIGFRLGFLGPGREEGAEGDIVRAGLGRLHRQMPGVVAGHADRRAVADQGPRLGIAGILLPDMDPVRAELARQIRPVVDQERHIVSRWQTGIRSSAARRTASSGASFNRN